jgi:hypothetical protein
MARAPTPAVDPAAEAAALLRRLGFATLVLLVPATALVARRAVVVLVPVAISLIVLAGMLDGDRLSLGRTLRRLSRSRGGLAAGLLLAWCALSLLWTPFVGPASERLLNIVLTIILALAGYVALPDRMRSANLYLIPVGTLAAALAGVFLSVGSSGRGGFDEDGQSLDRGLMVLTLFLWPSVAWLRSRGRSLEALGLAVAGAFAVAFGPSLLPLIALVVGALVYMATEANVRFGVRATAWAMAGLLALAPLLPFLASLVPSASGSPLRTFLESLAVWREVIVGEPVRLVTGHGFETALRGRLVGLLPANAPSTLLFEIWYELGLVGALALAAATFNATHAAGTDHPPLVPGMMAAFAAAFTLACLGVGTAQGWWFTALAAVVLVFVATERGQFRTRRPKANLRTAEEVQAPPPVGARSLSPLPSPQEEG